MRIAKRENDILAFHLSTISYANDIEIFFESRRHAGNRVGYQRAQTVQGAKLFCFALGDERPVFLLEINSVGHRDVHFFRPAGPSTATAPSLI